MFNFFKKECPVCKTKLEDNKKHPEGFGKEFCSDNCREEYRKMAVKEQSRKSHDCCH